MKHATAPVIWRQGVNIAGTILWCDAPRAHDLCFVSHGAMPSRGNHRQVLSTVRTMALLGASKRKHSLNWDNLFSPYGRRFTLGTLKLELFPSGHLPGAASLLVAAGGKKVIYAGEINPLRNGAMALAEACEIRRADTLVVAAPLAALGRVLPPRQEIAAALISAVSRARDDHMLPVILAPAIGGAQEAAVILASAGWQPWAHPRIAAYGKIYRQLGLELPALSSRPARPAPLLWPLELRNSPCLQRLGPLRLIAATGLALDPDFIQRMDIDEAVPLADHADMPALLEYVEATGAREVYFTMGYNAAVAQALVARGVEAFPLGPPVQMGLF